MKKIVVLCLVLLCAALAMANKTKKICSGKVVVYLKPACQFCVRLKSLLKEQNISYREIDISDKRYIVNWLISHTKVRTVPYVFIDDQYIGGYTDYVKLCSAYQKKK